MAEMDQRMNVWFDNGATAVKAPTGRETVLRTKVQTGCETVLGTGANLLISSNFVSTVSRCFWTVLFQLFKSK